MLLKALHVVAMTGVLFFSKNVFIYKAPTIEIFKLANNLKKSHLLHFGTDLLSLVQRYRP